MHKDWYDARSGYKRQIKRHRRFSALDYFVIKNQDPLFLLTLCAVPNKYYSYPLYVDKFEEAKVYVIPRKNVTLGGSWKWKDTMEEFVHDTLSYIGQYYLRNNSEAGFSADKRWFGWTVEQRREDKINTAITCTNLWHNLLNLYTT